MVPKRVDQNQKALLITVRVHGTSRRDEEVSYTEFRRNFGIPNLTTEPFTNNDL